ncbi:hypothetical protein EW145_g3706 [Phellinidium pouzarii]|uniref:BRCT domain-containing protein n=1 Tax=Phellinidium pouzarii TaxID=167371 RepID=A0A4V3XCS3_9AGAM|nr:hypothetical protein EW145_g3706 [Phellinidium pouzarii]
MSSSNSNPFQQQHSPGQQRQQHKRTRSQLQLPVFSVELARSPLKDARDARRKASIQHKSSLGLSDSREHDDCRRVEKDGKAEADGHTSLDEFRSEEPSVCMDTQPSVEDEILLSPRKQKPTSNPDANTDPIKSKRTRSPTFDDVFGELDKMELIMKRPSPVLNRNTSKKLKLQDRDSEQSTHGPLDAFFLRQPAKRSKESVPSSRSTSEFDAHSSSSSALGTGQGMRRIFSESSAAPPSSLDPQSIFHRPLGSATPSIKQLKSIPTLDLRTMTPSPRKPTLDVELGTPLVSKFRAINEGNSVRFERMDRTCDGSSSSENNMHKPEGGVRQNPPPPSSSPSPPTLPVLLTPSRVKTLDPFTSHNLHSGLSNSPSILEDMQNKVNVDPPTQSQEVIDSKASAEKTLDVVSSSYNLGHTPNATVQQSLETTPTMASPMTPLPPPKLTAPGRSEECNGSYGYEEEEEAMKAAEGSKGKESPTVLFAKPSSEEANQKTGINLTPDVDDPFALTSAAPSPLPSAKLLPSETGTSEAKVMFSEPGTSALNSKTKSSVITKAKKTVLAKRVPQPVSTSTPRMRLTRAAVLRQKQRQRILSNVSPSKEAKISHAQPSIVVSGSSTKEDVPTEKEDKKSDSNAAEEKQKARAPISKRTPISKFPLQSSTRRGSKEPRKDQIKQEQPLSNPRKSFVLTIPSSLSPLKSSSGPSASNSFSSTLPNVPSAAATTSIPLSKSKSKVEFPSKPFTFSLYPPPVTDPTAKARAQNTLSNLNTALEKLTMPPPSKPSSATKGELRPRPSTSLGFNREMSAPVLTRTGQESVPRPVSRAGSIGPAKRTTSFLAPPPRPIFASDTMDKWKLTAKPGEPAQMNSLFVSSATGARPASNFRVGGGVIGRMGTGLGRGGIFGRPISRIKASQKTNLETVEGSPVKSVVERQGEQDRNKDEADIPLTSLRPLMLQSTPSHNGTDSNTTTMTSGGEHAILDNGDSPDYSQASGKEKELKRISKLNASRRASMAFSALSQSLTTPTDDKGKNEGSSTTLDKPLGATRSFADWSPPNKQRAASASFSSSRPVRAAAARSAASTRSITPIGIMRSQSEVGMSLASQSHTFGESDEEGKSGRKSAMGRSKMPGSLDVLDQCTIFVDVRTEEGEDAGALFVDMLRSLGAKVLTRVGQSSTHIVYKNGLASTLARYRLLDEPRPSIVGIGWVVECAEKRERVDETLFQVDIDNMNVAGTLKISMSGPMDAFLDGNTPEHTKTGMDSDLISENSDTSLDRDIVGRSSLKSSGNYNPLEQARRRSMMFPRPLNG